MKTVAAAMMLAASFVAAPVIARADCGDPGQDPCIGPVPTVDQVVAVTAELTDPKKPAASKTDIVTPGFSPDEAGAIDDHLNRMNARGLLPFSFVVSDIRPAPANMAGATVTSTGSSWLQRSAPGPIVLTNQSGHWQILHDTAWTALDNFWYNANRRGGVIGGV